MEIKPNDIAIHQAAQWYARLSAPDCGPEEREAFRRWLRSDSSHEQAYQTAERTARLISDELINDPRLRLLAAEAFNEPVPRRHPKRSHFLRKHMHQAAAFIFALGVMFMATQINRWELDNSEPISYVNEQMRQQRINLADGSALYLDVGAKVIVTMNSQERQLELTRGRAFFEVAHDSSRPFSVKAAGTKVIALGTKFEVDVISQRLVNVTLAEGSVAVTNEKNLGGWRDVLSPGQQLQVDNALGRHQTRQVNASAVTSWSQGLLVFDGTPLQQALNEYNRYARVKVRLGDTSLANIPIGGNFVAGGDSMEFVETLSAVLPLSSINNGANEIALFHRYETQEP